MLGWRNLGGGGGGTLCGGTLKLRKLRAILLFAKNEK